MAQVQGGGPPVRRSSLAFALCLIAFGIFFLIMKMRPELDLGYYVYHFWPVVFIVLGVVILLDRMRGGASASGSGWIIGLVVFFLFLAMVSSVNSRHRRVQAFEDSHSTKNVDLSGATSASATFEFGAGELNLSGGASHLMEADFNYPEYDDAPRVNYSTSGSSGNLSVREPGSRGIHIGDNDSHWNVKLSDDTPLELWIKMGAGEGDVHAQGLQLTRLTVEMGAGELNLDLSGPWKKDFEGSIHGGVGEATIHLPRDVGVLVHARGGIGSVDVSGMRENGDEYTNDAYGKTPVTIHLNVEGGIGQINLICDR